MSHDLSMATSVIDRMLSCVCALLQIRPHQMQTLALPRTHSSDLFTPLLDVGMPGASCPQVVPNTSPCMALYAKSSLPDWMSSCSRIDSS